MSGCGTWRHRRDYRPWGTRRDIELRNAALEHIRELQRRYDDLVPVRALADGFQFRGRRVSFGSFYSGIFRPKELDGPAALCLVTAPPKSGRPPPYDDAIDDATGRLIYRFRATRTDTATAQLQAPPITAHWSQRTSLPCR